MDVVRASESRTCRVTRGALLLTLFGALLTLSSGSASAAPVATSTATTSCPTPLVGAQYAAPGGGRTVALTFDDGPGASTAAILKILQSFNVRATFFNIGENEANRPADVIAEAQGGFTLADHSWSHPFLTGLSPVGELAQIAQVGLEQRQLVGSSPCGLRPPYGAYDAQTLADASSLSMSTWMWNVDTQDWMAEGSGAPSWTSRIISLAESEGGVLTHPIVLMHNQTIPMPATLAALPTVIRYFQAHHYQFVDLLGRSAPLNACPNASPAFPHAASFLTSATPLAAGQSLRSPDAQYRLTEFARGSLAVLSGTTPTWVAAVPRVRGARARVLPSGYLVIQSSTGKILWQSSSGRRGDHLALGDDGSLALESGGHVWWRAFVGATTLRAGGVLHSGWSITTSNGACRLLVGGDGTLQLQSAAYGTLWSAPAVGIPHSSLVLDPRGDLVLISPRGQVTWTSQSSGVGASLVLDPVGRAAVTTPRGHWLWSTP